MRVLGDIVRLGAKRNSGKTALIMNETSLSYEELNQRVNRLAHGLLTQGATSGDRIALFGFNSIDWVVCNLAIVKIGAVVVALNFRYRADEVVYGINNSQASILIYSHEFEALIMEAVPQFISHVKLVAMDDRSELTVAELLDGQPTNEPPVSVDSEWPAALTYTSGTTGTPKGVLMSHAAFLDIYVSLIVEGDMIPGEMTMVSLPLFHSAGMHALVGSTLLMGGTALIVGSGFDPESILSLVTRHRISLTMWVPTQLVFLVNHPGLKNHDISSLKRIWYGSSPISPTVMEVSRTIFQAGFYQFYGQTETGMVTVLRPEDHLKRSHLTGREIFNSEMRVVDLEGQDVPVGQIGEIICAQATHGMIGYYNNPQATAETIKDGWIYTGDLARIDEEGYITIVDRVKDMIISGAENIYPKEVETAIISHPAVKEVAVFGIPDEIYGESICAAVVLWEGAEATEHDIIEHCADQISSYKKPKKVIFMSALPVNAMGKVTKNVLRAPFWVDREKRI